MISEHSALSTSLPVSFRIWLWRYTCLLLILMTWHRQAIFNLHYVKEFMLRIYDALTVNLSLFAKIISLGENIFKHKYDRFWHKIYMIWVDRDPKKCSFRLNTESIYARRCNMKVSIYGWDSVTLLHTCAIFIHTDGSVLTHVHGNEIITLLSSVSMYQQLPSVFMEIWTAKCDRAYKHHIHVYDV